MKVSSVFCLTVILLGSIASLKLKSNFKKTCKNFTTSQNNEILKAECKDSSGNFKSTSINLVENLIFYDLNNDYKKVGRCVPEEVDLKGFSYKLYCNLKNEDGFFKFTGKVDLSIYIENIVGNLLMSTPLDVNFFKSLEETPDRPNLK